MKFSGKPKVLVIISFAIILVEVKFYFQKKINSTDSDSIKQARCGCGGANTR